jgi:hypothetical protein
MSIDSINVQSKVQTIINKILIHNLLHELLVVELVF